MATEMEGVEYVPVLVAHSGPQLDFPMMYRQVDKSPMLAAQLRHLQLHYVDTLSVFIELKRIKPWYQQLRSLSLKNIYTKYFKVPYEGHRALADAKALYRIFSEAPPARDLHIFANHTLNRKEVEKMREQIEQFQEASIHSCKAIELLQRGITLNKLVSEYQSSLIHFTSFLEKNCRIINPIPELMAYLKHSNSVLQNK